ncbi:MULTISPECIES: arsenosugar biosynthesis radical SAM (seleno)protein ArsS [unclassified Adlercreutzia]|uniref:arsenosugar biosynthesis radical SAM (seleno)protein ArsS n=1 Tax=unclassified Adlercreutzia TaxID=2636013 RepID=UPI0013E9F899|nr:MULTISPECIES: arsenosugar biosynthesis radical SAM (seleno)protein ArsS [unclassified Adlercreutzia]
MSSCAAHGVKRRLFKDAGRACPVDYRIASDAFAGVPQVRCEVLYVVGGLYGNPFALDAIDALVEAEGQNTLVVLNGDVHWFDKTAENFAAVERRIERYVPLVGNVEAELRRQVDVGVGCGCAYPECTSDESVSRSNRIHKMLSIAVDAHPELKEPLEGRPAVMAVDVAGFKVGITHGDEKLIGGWGCSRESLQDIMRQDEIDRFMADNGIDVLATTHTCAPAAVALARGCVINNGAAGLPNFAGQRYGLAIRIAETPHDDALFGCELDGLFVQAVPVRYDHDAFLAWFDNLWDELSPAAVSYRDRIVDGPDDRLADALLGGFAPGPTARREARERADVRGEGVPRATQRDVARALAKLLYFEDMVDDPACLFTVAEPSTLQLNVTARCNLACAHCHVGSGPSRTEAMGRAVLEAALKVARDHAVDAIDITGGAPEMHPDIAWLLREAVKAAPHVMVRSNLVILQDPAYAPLLDLYAELGVEVVASLPNVFSAQADMQRGRRVYDATLEVLGALNARGYGCDGDHVLSVVFNPQEPVLPPAQADLEALYRRRLTELGLSFDNLFAVANNPIGRYGASLIDAGSFDNYLDLLIDSFNADTCPNMMCRHQLSIGWDGRVYDCDFNQALGLEATDAAGAPLTVFDYAANPARSLARPIAFGNHCYACTAGFGSSCGGTLVQG